MTSSPAPGPDSREELNSSSGAALAKRPPHAEFAAPRWLPVLIVAAGFVVRIIPASRLFLNPDEALHNLLATQASVSRAWAAALTNAHPPLLILVLYYWRWLGHSELWLRLPSVLAGTAACWLFYRWLTLVADHFTALLGLLLACFAPALILLSAEVRQYALLLFFIAGCLYFSEQAVQKNSPGLMVAFSLSLYGAVLTHYSALMFAFAIGVFMLARLYPYRQRGLLWIWAAGQIVGIAIAAYFLVTHIPRLRETGMVRTDLESYLRKAVFHPGERNPVAFVGSQTLRVFTYVFSHGLIGTLMLLAFLAGLIWLLRKKPADGDSSSATGPSSRQLALLLGLPFVVNWAVSLAGLYPLGATRHSVFLAPFAIAGACFGISWIPASLRLKAIVVMLALAVCNFFPAPPPPIRAKDQSAVLMKDAVAYLHASVPAGSAILTDYESGLLLGYYFCGHGVVQVFPPQRPITRAGCGQYAVIATSFRDWKFTADTFPAQFAAANKLRTPGTELWLFYAGWINDSAPALKSELDQFGCTAPQSFGDNILICRLSADAQQTSDLGPARNKNASSAFCEGGSELPHRIKQPVSADLISARLISAGPS